MRSLLLSRCALRHTLAPPRVIASNAWGVTSLTPAEHRRARTPSYGSAVIRALTRLRSAMVLAHLGFLDHGNGQTEVARPIQS
jgi:hypothetical protein